MDDSFKIVVPGKRGDAKEFTSKKKGESPARYTYHGVGRRVNDRVCVSFFSFGMTGYRFSSVI